MSHDRYTLAPLTPLRNSSININSCLHFMVVRFGNVICQMVLLSFLVSREGEKEEEERETKGKREVRGG